MYKSKPDEYVSWIITHEGKGSLFSYLQKKMWCLQLLCCPTETSMYTRFSLSLVLTNEGHEHLKEVLDAVFSYINMLRRRGPQKRIYDEISSMRKINFRFADEEEPVDNVESLSSDMHNYPPLDYLTGRSIYFEFNPNAIQDCMDMLSPDNVNILICNKKFNDEEFNKVEPWFKTKYVDEEIPPEWTNSWKTIEPFSEFHLPEPNIFIATDFDLIPIPEDTPKYPVKIHSDEILEVWYKPDPIFRLPECYMLISLILSDTTIQSTVMLRLLDAILNHLLVEETYAMKNAGLGHNIHATDRRMFLALGGYNQKQPILLNSILKTITNCSNLISENLFNIWKEKILQSHYNTFINPSNLADDLTSFILLSNHMRLTDKYAAISDLEYSQFLNFVKHFTDHLRIECLVQGNMTQEDVLKNIKGCTEILNCKPLLPNTSPKTKATQIPTGAQYCRVKNYNSKDTNSIVINYYQSTIYNTRFSMIIDLLMLIMREPLFNQLRTIEKLGYDVCCEKRVTNTLLGFSISVCTQATKFTTEHVDDRIEEFLKSFKELIFKMTEEEFSNFKESLLKSKQCADNVLWDEINRNWNEIKYATHVFDRIEKNVAVIESITLEELREWIEANIKNGSSFRKLSIHVVGRADNEEDLVSSDLIKGIENIALKDSTCEDITKRIEAKFPLEYLTNLSTEEAENSDKCYILNIEEFKESLNISDADLIKPTTDDDNSVESDKK